MPFLEPINTLIFVRARCLSPLSMSAQPLVKTSAPKKMMPNDSRPRFHLAFNVTDLNLARHFYVIALGCTEGRSTASWVDFDFYGHQLSLHLGEPMKTALTGIVDGVQVPMPHFGLCMNLQDWQLAAQRLQAAQVVFVLPPHVRYAGQAGEQGTMFFCDPFGNPIELKGFKDFAGVFAV